MYVCMYVHMYECASVKRVCVCVCVCVCGRTSNLLMAQISCYVKFCFVQNSHS